jgi:hypothetical protein
LLWMLWLLIVPVLGACLLLFALGRAAGKPDPKLSSMSAQGSERAEKALDGSPAVQRRFVAGPLYRGLSAQAGHVRFLAETRKRRARRHGAEGVAPD